VIRTGDLSFRVLSAADAQLVLPWIQPPATLPDLLNRDNAYYSILGAAGEILGCCCFGAAARVDGGEYQAQAVDIRAVTRPDLDGEPELGEIVRGVTLFARALFSLLALRTTVPVRQRLIRAWESAGFLPLGRFDTPGDSYLQLALPPSNLG